jgi:hypothetical protein
MIWTRNDLEKQAAREVAFDCGPRKSVLLMPGYSCEDAKLALSKNVINENTTVVFVERDDESHQEIKRWVETEWLLPLPPLIYNTDLCEIKLIPIDFAYIDLFGNLTKKDWRWIETQLVPNLMPGSQLCFTFCQTVRNQFMQNVMSCMQSKSVYQNCFNSLPKNIKGLARPLAATYKTLFESGFMENYTYDVDFHTYRNQSCIHSMLLFKMSNIQRK